MTFDFDFDYWAQLYATDPEAFTRERQAAAAAVIATCPDPDLRKRLSALQSNIELEILRAKTPWAPPSG